MKYTLCHDERPIGVASASVVPNEAISAIVPEEQLEHVLKWLRAEMGISDEFNDDEGNIKFGGVPGWFTWRRIPEAVQEEMF